MNKKIIILYFLSTLHLMFALEFNINAGREAGKNFAVLSIMDDREFLCEEVFNKESEVQSVLCSFSSQLISRFSKSSDTLFFSILPEVKDGKFYLRIIPKKKIKLFNTGFDINSRTPIPLEHRTHSKKWQILGYEDEILFVDEKPSNGLNFPITFYEEGEYPSIGALDFQMLPMEDGMGADKNYFLKIQAAIKSENYENALELIEDMLKLYPNTIFKRDILYLKIVALDSLGKEEYYQDILQLSKEWYDSYPADINVPEILYILAKTYAKMDFFEEATHYYHRLFEEYKGSDFELLGKLEYGKNLYARGDRKTVLEIYQSVLAQSKNVEIASLASILIAEYYKNAGNKEQAQKYLEDVLRANPGFFAEDISYYHHLMKEWSESGIYFVPAQVAESMFKILDEDSKDYKDLLKDVALWYDKSGNFPKAHYYYQLLLQQKLDEQERSMFQNLDDSLLLKYDEEDVAKRLEHYEYVLKNYKGKEEAQKALAKKIQTLLEQKRYQEIFDLRQTLEESNPILLEAVSELTKEALLQNNCRDASYYGGLYAEKIPLSDEQSFALFECLYQNKRYKPAQQIAQVRSQDSNTAKQKEKWLYALAWAEYQMQNYPKATLAARDALSLLSDSAYNDVVWVLFMALSDQNRKQEALNLLPTLEEKLQDSDKMIEVYRIVLLDAIERKDDTAIEIYAKKLMDLQTKYSRHEYSPWVELSLVDAFNRESRFAESLTLLKDAEKYATKPLETVQIYYLEGYLNSKLKKNQESLEAYTKCEEVEIQSPWKNLCKDAKRLLENQIKDNQSIEEK